ncbi:hypothetical protein KDM41_18985, partial [bacterium]|nr:hypothetical protein [bacterium]
HRYVNRRLIHEDEAWQEVMQAPSAEEAHEIEGPQGELDVHRMDCVDCHNRVGHRFRDPAYAIDEELRLGELPADLPYIKARSLGALTGNYNDEEQAMRAIRRHLVNYYERYFPELAETRDQEIEAAVARLQELYRTNIHPGMNVGWNPYPDNMGHRGDTGCFRCHNPDMQDET